LHVSHWQSFGPASQNNCGGLLCGHNVMCGVGNCNLEWILGNMKPFFERIRGNCFLVVVVSNRVGKICDAYMHSS
jgi:hypothetical protein